MQQLPITVYERPSLALANLMRLDAEGALKSLFRPEDLSPSQLEQFEFMRKRDAKSDNPILRTAAELATNPAVWLGLVMVLAGKYGRLAGPDKLTALFKEGSRFVKDVPIAMRFIASPLTGYRAIWNTGVWEQMNLYSRQVVEFLTKYKTRQEDIFKWYASVAKQPLTKRQRILIGAALDGFGDPEASAKLVGKTALGGRPIIENLRQKLAAENPHLPELVDRLRNLLADARNDLFGNLGSLHGVRKRLYERILEERLSQLRKAGVQLTDKQLRLVKRDASREVSNAMRQMIARGELGADVSMLGAEMAAKGIDIVDQYFPHFTSRLELDRYLAGYSGIGSKQYRAALQRYMTRLFPSFAKQRRGFSLPNQADLEYIKDLISPQAYARIQALETTRIREFTNLLHSIIGTGDLPDINELARIIRQKDPTLLAKLESSGDILDFMHRLRYDLLAAMGLKDYQRINTVVAQLGKILGAPARYTLDVAPALDRYINAASTTYAWLSKGTGRRIHYMINNLPAQEIVETAKGVYRNSYRWIIDDWNTSLGPMLRGLKTPQEWARHRVFSDYAFRFADWLSQDGAAQKLIPASVKSWLMEGITSSRSLFSDRTLGGKLAGLYYTSALGLNLSPTIKNLSQPFLTVLPLAGPRAMLDGLSVIARRIEPFTRIAAKEGIEKAFQQVFPEFYKWYGGESISAAIAAGDISQETYAAALQRGVKTAYDKVLQGLMMPFATSEKFNRLWAFYTFREAGRRAGLSSVVKTAASVPELDLFAKTFTDFTQFTGGPLGQPRMLRGVWAPFRQFMHFPLRYLEYLYGSTAFGPDPNIPSLRVLGGSLLTSIGAYTLGKNLLGINLGSGMMAEALPSPAFEGAPFYPMPFVPPVIGTLGAAMTALYSGDIEPLKRAVPLHLPGGLAVSRVYRTLAPKYADYENRTPDGRIPLYNDKGMLIATATPLQLVLRSMGIIDADQMKERALTRYLLRQREVIRDFRRRYLDALMNNDLEAADRIQRQYQKKYPDLPPLRVHKSDIRAVTNRRTQSRIQRILRSIRGEDRAVFSALVEQAGLGHVAANLDESAANPELLLSFLPDDTLLPSPSTSAVFPPPFPSPPSASAAAGAYTAGTPTPASILQQL